MKLINLIRYTLLASALSASTFAQPTQNGNLPQSDSSPLKNATILIIRHAEKPDSGLGLSPAGQQRAEAYTRYFKKLQIDSKPLKLDYLFATADSKGSHRPRLTLEPLGNALGLKIDDRFKNKNFQELADEIRSKDHGKTILICWHHGEIPALARALGADPARLLPEGKWPEQKFGWMLLLQYDEQGRLIPGKTRRLNENLMPADSD